LKKFDQKQEKEITKQLGSFMKKTEAEKDEYMKSIDA